MEVKWHSDKVWSDQRTFLPRKPLNWETDSHPLALSVLPKSSKAKGDKKKSLKKSSETTVVDSPGFVDPLTAASLDPLGENSTSNEDEDDALFNLESESKSSTTKNEAWRQLEAEIIESSVSFTGKVDIPTPLHYLFAKMDDAEAAPSAGNPTARLEWLENTLNGGSGSLRKSDLFQSGLTRLDFFDFIELCNNQLAKYWKDEQKVQVVKMTIQLSKMLSKPEQLHFYPAVFCLVTDLISYFGQLVYDRLVSKCPDLRVNFNFSDVSSQASELCKNWLYKIASIRELVPRFYLDAAMLKCYRFSCDISGYPSLVERLTLMVRGIADPIVSGYARAYLVQCTQQALMSINPELARRTARHNYEEFISIFRYCGVDNVRFESTVSVKQYLELFTPIIQWLLAAQMVGLPPEDAARDDSVKRCFNEADNLRHPGLVVHCLLDVAPANLVAGELTRLCHVTCSCNDDAYPASKVLAAFAQALLRSTSALNLKLKSRKQPLQSAIQQVWQTSLDKVIKSSMTEFLSIAATLLKVTNVHFETKHVDSLLGSILQVVAVKDVQTTVTLRDDCKEKILSILQEVLKDDAQGGTSTSSVERITSLNNFLPLYDLLDNNQRVLLAKDVLGSWSRSPSKITDTVAHNAFIYLAGVLAESINALTIQDETRQISASICRVIEAADFGDDLERRLKFYTECRGKFKRLEIVQVRLVHCVLRLAVEARNQAVVTKSTSTRIRGFLQACVAYAYITVPSILNSMTKLMLYLLTTQIAYLCHCYGQAEASLDALIASLDELKPEVVAMAIQDFVPQLLSYLLVVPDHGEVKNMDLISLTKRTLGAASGLLNATSTSDQLMLGLLYIKAIQLMSIASANKPNPYSIAGVASNDVLWYDDKSLKMKQEVFIFDLLELVSNRMDFFLDQGQKQPAVTLASAILNCLASHCDSTSIDEQPRLREAVTKSWIVVVQKDKDYPRKQKLFKHVGQKLLKRNPSLTNVIQL